MKHTKWIAALLGMAGLVAAKSPVETYGALSISGNKMVDETGKPVILRGMSLFWHYDLGGKDFYNPSAVRWVMTDWRASVIRAAIGVEDRNLGGGGKIGGAISDPNLANLRVRTIIDAAISAGFYVVVDWHAHQEHTSEAVAWFGKLAQEYGNTPNIIWEIFNEPIGGISVNYAKAVITEIRKYSRNVILVGSSNYTQNPQEWGNDLNSFPNIAYTIHFYSNHTFWGNVTAAMTKGHAVFASEWGMSSYSGDGGFQSPTTGNIKSWLDVLENNGVSSCNWFIGNALAEGAAAGSIQQTSASLRAPVSGYSGPTFTPSATNPWTDTDLTESGKAIRTWLRSKNPAWTLNDTTLKVVSPLAFTSAKKTDFILGQDTIKYAVTFSKPVSWAVTEKARTSAAEWGRTSSAPASSVTISRLAGVKNITSKNFQPGEVVDVTFTPMNQKLSYTLSTVTGVAKRVHETQLKWIGSRLFLPHDLVVKDQRVQVSVRDASGKALFSTSATVGGFSHLELGPRPKSSSLQILDITTDDAVIRARLAPHF
jgi:endoglucanase